MWRLRCLVLTFQAWYKLPYEITFRWNSLKTKLYTCSSATSFWNKKSVFFFTNYNFQKPWNMAKIKDLSLMCLRIRNFSGVNLKWVHFTKSIYVKSEQVVGNNGLLTTVG